MKIREMIRNYADANADVIVIGSFGYKKEKAENFASIGSTTANVTNGCKAVSIVVNRDTIELPLRKSRRFMCAIDGSDMSHCAVEEAMRYMRKGDYLQIVYIETPDGKAGKAIIEKYDEFLITNKVKGACKCVKHNPDVTIADELLDVAETGDELSQFGAVNVLVMGSCGLSKALPPKGADNYEEYKKAQRTSTKKGSVAQSVITGSKTCAVMCITIDSLLSGAVKSASFSEWFDGKTDAV